MKAIVLFGAPGSGKGTVAEKLKAATDYIHISTGDMLREAVKKGTPVGREAEGYMKRGALVPDEVIIKLVEERLDRGVPDDLYMFDGFPRTIPQAELLEKSLGRRGGKITHVIFLETPRDVIIQRLTGRRTCRKCGWNCHVVNLPPKKAGVCDVCGGELYQRPDDQEATIVNRLDVYNKQTESLVARYEKQKVLVRVNSNQKLDVLVGEIRQILK
jgi:adenylate kinase